MAPVSYWKYAYQLPSDRLTNGVIKAFASNSEGESLYKNFEIQGDKLLTDIDAVWIDYQTDKDEASWPPYFVELMEYAMAAKLAYPITDQQNLAQDMHQKAFGLPSENFNGGLFGNAKSRNSQETPPQVLEDFTLINARFAGV
jgi:hypothetical protein